MTSARQRFLLAALTVISLLFVFPVIWMALTALRPPSEIFTRTLHVIPTTWKWDNLWLVWSTYPIADWLWNSTVVAVLGGVLTVVLDLLAGYAFAKFDFRGRDALFILFLATLMLPTQVLLVPQFLIVARLGGVNTYWAVIVPRAAETYGVFLARQFLSKIPDELLDAARLDGAGEWSIFWRIVLPLARPAIAVLSLLLILGNWNDFGWPLVVLKERRSLTLPVGLSFLQGEHVTDWTGIMAVALISVLPAVLLFLATQRQFVQGIARTGIK